MRTTPDNITSLQPHEIFVFGSNLAGRHGGGAALTAARLFGARRGIGVGRCGQSYAIPTKDERLRSLPLLAIESYVRAFLFHADLCNGYSSALGRPTNWIYLVTPIGCGLAGYNPEDIAPMFRGAPDYVILPRVFLDVLGGQDHGR